MLKTHFNQILDETIKFSSAISPQRKEEIYAYVFKLAKADHRKKQRVLINEGNIADSIYLLLSGTCKFYYYSKIHNQELIPFLMVSPCLLAEGRSMYKNLPARFSIEVFEPCVVYRLSKEAITAITEKYPEVEPGIRQMVKQQSHDFKAWKKGLWKVPPEERYKKLRDTDLELIQRMKKKDIAAHLGIKDPSFSRLLRRLGDKLCFL